MMTGRNTTILSLILLLNVSITRAQLDLEEFLVQQIGRCETNGLPTILPLPKSEGYLISSNDSTFVSFPDNQTYTMNKADLLNERSKDFDLFFNYQDTLYMAHGGGGVVYSFDGNTLKRIDESFFHHNQYGAIPFEYQGNFYLFGGSGLFSRKNFITRFDRSAREWLLQTTTGQRPSFGKSMAGIVIDNGFYVIAESNQESETDDQNLSDEKDVTFSIYRLNLTTWAWTLQGSVPKVIAKDLKEFKFSLFEASTYLLYLNSKNGLFALDFITNSITKYTNDYPLKGMKILALDDQGIDYLYCDSNQFYRKGNISNQELSKHKIYTKELYQANLKVYYNTLLQVIGVLAFVSLVLILINELKFERRIVIRLKGGSIFYRSKTIRVFDQNEQLVLLNLGYEDQISFSAIEDIVAFKNDSQSVRIKKRDRCLRILNEKIATIFNHNSEERDDYFIIESGSDDKRSKFIRMNMDYFKVM